MKATTLREFFEHHEGAIVPRIVYVYNLLLAFRDGEDRALQEFRVLCKRYQLEICRVIRMQCGEIMHTAGDAFVAVFRGDDAASRAFAAARNMLASVARIQKSTDFHSLETSFVTRIGLATGKAHHGYLGPYEMKERTVFGRCVNVGSRLEGAVKQHSPSGGILLAPETAAEIKDFKRDDFQEVSVPIKELNKNLTCYLLPSGNSLKPVNQQD
jgi:class 3 adenylate cyclase